MQPRPLPPELWDIIFSFLHDDCPSLRSCAGVSKQFYGLVEKHLYRQVTITNHGGLIAYADAYSSEQIARLLANRPHLVSHVRSLNIEMFLCQASVRIRSEQSIGRTISLFPRLTEISLVGVPGDMISWITFHGDLQTSFAHILRLPSVESVTIQDIQHFPLRLLDCCTHLKNLVLLRVQGLGIHSPLASTTAPAGALSMLQTLELSKGVSTDLGILIFWLISPRSPPTTTLDVLRIHLAQIWDVPLFQLLLSSKFAQSVKNLHIDANSKVRTIYHTNANHQLYRTSSPNNDYVWDLSSLVNLQNLEISASMESVFATTRYGPIVLNNSYVLYTPIPWITHLLQNPSQPLTRPSRVILALSFAPNFDVFLLEMMDWKPLVDTLWELSQHHSLRTVEIRIKGPSQSQPTYYDVQEIVAKFEDNRHFAMLIRKGILIINSSHSVSRADQPTRQR